MTTACDFFVRPRHDARLGHVIQAESFEAAAIAFVERWSPPIDQDGDVALVIRDQANGRELCLTLDLDSGEAHLCG